MSLEQKCDHGVVELLTRASTRAERKMARDLCAYGYKTAVIDLAWRDIVPLLPFHAFVVRVPSGKLALHTHWLISSPRARAVIVQWNEGDTIDQLSSLASHLHRLRFHHRHLSLHLTFPVPPTPVTLRRVLAAVTSLPVHHTLLSSKAPPVSLQREGDYVGVVTDYADLFAHTTVEIHFLPSLRPVRCAYLDPARHLISLRNVTLLLCPRHDPSPTTPTATLTTQLTTVASYARTITRVRLTRYAWGRCPFDCRSCVQESSFVMGR